jgi:hypothetical protein
VLGVECAVDTTIIKLCPVGAIKPTLCFLAETKYFARGYVQNTPVQSSPAARASRKAAGGRVTLLHRVYLERRQCQVCRRFHEGHKQPSTLVPCRGPGPASEAPGASKLGGEARGGPTRQAPEEAYGPIRVPTG